MFLSIIVYKTVTTSPWVLKPNIYTKTIHLRGTPKFFTVKKMSHEAKRLATTKVSQ